MNKDTPSPSTVVIDIRSPEDASFAQSIADFDPTNPAFKAVTLKAALSKKFPKYNYENVTLVMFIVDQKNHKIRRLSIRFWDYLRTLTDR